MYARKSSSRSSSSLLPTNIDFMSVALLILGIGSFLFHASLRQTLEFVDELSMLILNWAMLNTMMQIRQPDRQRRIIYSLVLATVYISFSVFYVYSALIIYQVIAFLTGIGITMLRTQYLFSWVQPAFPAEQSKAWNRRSWQAVGISSLGYLLWNIDLEFCKELRDMKAAMGLPLSWLLELHGWWHIMTAIGADQFMMVAREMRESDEKLLQENGKAKKEM